MDPVIPRATAAVRARRIRCLFAVILEIGLFGARPLIISLGYENRKKSSVFGGGGVLEDDLPVKDKGISRV